MKQLLPYLATILAVFCACKSTQQKKSDQNKEALNSEASLKPTEAPNPPATAPSSAEESRGRKKESRLQGTSSGKNNEQTPADANEASTPHVGSMISEDKKNTTDFRNLGVATLMGAFIGGSVALGGNYAIGKTLGVVLSGAHQENIAREISGMKKTELKLKDAHSAVVYEPLTAGAEAKRFIVFLPGNLPYQDESYNEIFKGLSTTRASVVTMNYQGMVSGESAPSSAGAWIDQSKSLIKKVIDLAEGDLGKVTVVGHSMGGAIGTYAVADLHGEGLPVKFVAHNTFSSFGDVAVAKGITPVSAGATDAIAKAGGWELKVAEKFKSIPEKDRIYFDAEADDNIEKAQLGTKVAGKQNLVGQGHFTDIFREKQFLDFHQRAMEVQVQKKTSSGLSRDIKGKAKATGVGAAAGAAVGAGVQVIIDKTKYSYLSHFSCLQR